METVSKELFSTEIKNIKEGMSDVKSDIRELKDSINALTVSINGIKVSHVENITRIKQLEDVAIKASSGMEDIVRIIDTINTNLVSLDKRVVAIERYPTYTKWTFGIILTSLMIWKAIKEHMQ